MVIIENALLGRSQRVYLITANLKQATQNLHSVLWYMDLFLTNRKLYEIL